MSDLDCKFKELDKLSSGIMSREFFVQQLVVDCGYTDKQAWQISGVDDLIESSDVRDCYLMVVDRGIVEQALKLFQESPRTMFVRRKDNVIPILERLLSIGEDAWKSTYRNLDGYLEGYRNPPSETSPGAKKEVEELLSEMDEVMGEVERKRREEG